MADLPELIPCQPPWTKGKFHALFVHGDSVDQNNEGSSQPRQTWLNEPQRILLQALCCLLGGGILWTVLIVLDVWYHSQDRGVEVCNTEFTSRNGSYETPSDLPAIYGLTVAQHTFLLLLVIAAAMDLVREARKITRPELYQDDAQRFHRWPCFTATLTITVVVSSCLALFTGGLMLDISNKRACFHHASLVWYFVWSLPGLALWIVVVTGLAALIGFTVVGLIFAGVTTAVQYSYTAFTEAQSYSPV